MNCFIRTLKNNGGKTDLFWDDEETHFILVNQTDEIINFVKKNKLKKCDFYNQVLIDIAFSYESSNGIYNATNKSGDVEFKIYRNVFTEY